MTNLQANASQYQQQRESATFLRNNRTIFMAHIFVLNGANLNFLGTREPKHYGSETLLEIEKRMRALAEAFNHQLDFIQSNHEGVLIDAIYEAAKQKVDFFIINPAAFTHTSVALRDALAAVNIPFVEVHLSNIYCREQFRHHSYFSDIAIGVISGMGAIGYELALLAAERYLSVNA